jgi:putative NIF3 family GTP cyclohydrolase 1 type 2
MTIQQIYDLAIEMGMKADPRGYEKVRAYMKMAREEYEELPAKKKKFFDEESLRNPYSDTRILFGDPTTRVDKLLAGIDAETGEVLLVDRLNEKGAGVDLLISHHPAGQALAGLYEVMDLQVDVYAEQGVPVNVADALFRERMGYVQRRFNPLNHTQGVDAARLLDIPFMVIHTVWDNLGDNFMKNYIAKKEYHTVGEVLDHINEIPEFTEAIRGKNGPQIVSGSRNSRAGKVMVNFTGGTNPSSEIYKEVAKAGVGTIVEMHVDEKDVQAMKKMHVNLIDAGHMAADSIGANIFLDELEKKGVEVIPCSGLIRIKRSKLPKGK